jgi:hypothetical protein
MTQQRNSKVARKCAEAIAALLKYATIVQVAKGIAAIRHRLSAVRAVKGARGRADSSAEERRAIAGRDGGAEPVPANRAPDTSGQAPRAAALAARVRQHVGDVHPGGAASSGCGTGPGKFSLMLSSGMEYDCKWKKGCC